MNLKSICLIAAAAFVSLRVALPRLTSRLGARCRLSARGRLEMGAGIIFLIKTLAEITLNGKLHSYLNRWEEGSLLCSVLGVFIGDWQSCNSWKLMFLKCWRDFSLRPFTELSDLVIAPAIPPHLSQAAESFFLIWEGDKPLSPTYLNVSLFCLAACSVQCGCSSDSTDFSSCLCWEI